MAIIPMLPCQIFQRLASMPSTFAPQYKPIRSVSEAIWISSVLVHQCLVHSLLTRIDDARVTFFFHPEDFFSSASPLFPSRHVLVLRIIFLCMMRKSRPSMSEILRDRSPKLKVPTILGQRGKLRRTPKTFVMKHYDRLSMFSKWDPLSRAKHSLRWSVFTRSTSIDVRRKRKERTCLITLWGASEAELHQENQCFVNV